MPPQARLGDMHVGATCTVTGPMAILPPCAVTVLVGNNPAARVTDMMLGMMLSPVGAPVPTPPHPIVKGSATVLISKLPAARVGDTCAMGGTIIPPCEVTVITGG